MAKNIKYRQVDYSTGVSVGIAKVGPAGAKNPDLSGLIHQFETIDGSWRFGTCDDSVTVDNNNDQYEVTDSEYITEIQGTTTAIVENWKREVYEYEKQIRDVELFNDYSQTVYSAAPYKYDAALAFLNNGTANAGLTTEANARGITVTALANKIKTNHENYITIDAKIAGLRGLLYDRISSISINTSSVSTALASYAGISTTEQIGTLLRTPENGGEFIDTVTGITTNIEPIMAPYYDPGGLKDRYDYL